MTKYIIFLVALIVAGGAFLYSTQTADAPTAAQVPQAENPFGEGSTAVGTAEETPAVPTNTTGTIPAAQPGIITRIELAKHNTQADCWIGYKGIVYDITNWLPRHPGSAGAIAPFCGTADEFAAAFNQQHKTKQESRLQKEGVKEGALGD